MVRARKNIGAFVGVAVAGAITVLALGSVTMGNVHLQLAGLDVSVENQIERGLIIKIDGAECPGAGCPAFALDWDLARRG